MQIDNSLSFDQFSHDLALALEETSRGTGARWGRRRTRSTGNLPFPPLPTEEESSSTDPNVPVNNGTVLSDSDDRQPYAFSFNLRQAYGNFESDSLNENFSPSSSRPNIRRKRKFKRMAVEYETTPSTPQTANHSLFPISGTVKKRSLKNNQENFRANLFFGKRKRPHRERFAEYESYKHSSSVPRQRSGFLSQRDGGMSYYEYKSRNRASSMSTARGNGNEKILPLNKSIVSKIEKISQNKKFNFTVNTKPLQLHVDIQAPSFVLHSLLGGASSVNRPEDFGDCSMETNAVDDSKVNLKLSRGSGSFESALPVSNNENKIESNRKGLRRPAPHYSHITALHHKRKQNRLKLQFDDQSLMDCGNFNDFLSSSSLSSTDSETEETNESDHEGDDELTDWPGHEAMVNFASKNEFKRASKKVGKLPQIKQQDQDDDTLMSADEVDSGTPVYPINMPSHPINIVGTLRNTFIPSSGNGVSDPGYGSSLTASYNLKQPIESEMSGETSNTFLSSPVEEVREIRAGCRRIREERPGFSIVTSFNEDLLRFLQDEQQKQMKIYDIHEYDKILELAKLYSLHIQTENGCIFLNKTSNTMQAVKVSKEHQRYFISDYKRRCVGGDTE